MPKIHASSFPIKWVRGVEHAVLQLVRIALSRGRCRSADPVKNLARKDRGYVDWAAAEHISIPPLADSCTVSKPRAPICHDSYKSWRRPPSTDSAIAPKDDRIEMRWDSFGASDRQQTAARHTAFSLRHLGCMAWRRFASRCTSARDSGQSDSARLFYPSRLCAFVVHLQGSAYS